MVTTSAERRSFVAPNISGSMFRDTAAANPGFALEITPVTFDMLRGKDLISLINQPAIINHIKTNYGINIPMRSDTGIRRIKLQLDDTLYTVEAVDGPSLKVSSKSGELLPPGTRLQLTRYRFVPKQL